MKTSEIALIRKIYQTKDDFMKYPELRESLFKSYYPQLDFQLFQNANMWHCLVFMDYCGDLMDIDPNSYVQESGLFGDKPGPVG